MKSWAIKTEIKSEKTDYLPSPNLTHMFMCMHPHMCIKNKTVLVQNLNKAFLRKMQKQCGEGERYDLTGAYLLLEDKIQHAP